MSTADQIAAAVANTGGTEDPTLLATAITEGYAATPAQESDAIHAAKAIAAIPTAGENAAEIANNQDAADYALGILDAAVNGIAAAATGVGNTLLGTVANNSSVNTNTANNNPSSTGGSISLHGASKSCIDRGKRRGVRGYLAGRVSSYIIAGAAGIILMYSSLGSSAAGPDREPIQEICGDVNTMGQAEEAFAAILGIGALVVVWDDWGSLTSWLSTLGTEITSDLWEVKNTPPTTTTQQTTANAQNAQEKANLAAGNYEPIILSSGQNTGLVTTLLGPSSLIVSFRGFRRPLV